MYQRFVGFKFKESTPADAIQRHLAMFAVFKNAIPKIVSYAGGKTYAGSEGADRYDSAHYVTYMTEEDIGLYFYHAASQKFIEANKAHWEDVLVVDSEIIL
jgi:hypothetical protein